MSNKKIPLSGISTSDSEGEYEDYSESEESMKSTPITIIARISQVFNFSAIRSQFSRFYTVFGNLAWMFTTSVLLVGLPILFAYDREKNYEAFEAEQSRFKSDEEKAKN